MPLSSRELNGLPMSAIVTPIIWLTVALSPCAIRFGRYPSSSITWAMRAFVSSDIYPKFPCRYREIVVFDTPTAAATSPMLGCRFVFVLLMTPIVHHSHVIAEHPR